MDFDFSAQPNNLFKIKPVGNFNTDTETQVLAPGTRLPSRVRVEEGQYNSLTETV